ncbi:hypothetical protein LTR15_004290 [Elasticomyces elasticus]|nr:hypothetical protein LTR15_004290 [Elasticomyces elasticus]
MRDVDRLCDPSAEEDNDESREWEDTPLPGVETCSAVVMTAVEGTGEVSDSARVVKPAEVDSISDDNAVASMNCEAPLAWVEACSEVKLPADDGFGKTAANRGTACTVIGAPVIVVSKLAVVWLEVSGTVIQLLASPSLIRDETFVSRLVAESVIIIADVVLALEAVDTEVLALELLALHIEATVLDEETALVKLPICLAVAFGLVYDPSTDLYPINTTTQAQLVRSDPTLTLTLAANATSSSTVNIVLPHSAFNLEIGLPFYNGTASYFPIRRASSDSQYDVLLGRTFFQEAYVAVDWERATSQWHTLCTQQIRSMILFQYCHCCLNVLHHDDSKLGQ